MTFTQSLLDVPYLGKSFKASQSREFLKLLDERICLSFSHLLTNRSSKNKMKIMEKLIPKKDCVWHKDRGQDPADRILLHF